MNNDPLVAEALVVVHRRLKVDSPPTDQQTIFNNQLSIRLSVFIV